jgi:hypothetical protein
MQLTRHASHAMWEPCHIGHDRAIRAAVRCPAVIEDDVIISQISKAPIDNLPRGAEKEILAHVAGIRVPIVLGLTWSASRLVLEIEYSANPAHLRCDSETIVAKVSRFSGQQPCQRESYEFLG